MATKKAAGETVVTLMQPKIKKLHVRIKGTTPLLTCRMPDSVKFPPPPGEKAPPLPHDPEERWLIARHVIDEEAQKFGIPGAAIFKSLVSAGGRWGGRPMTEWRGLFRIQRGLLEIIGDPPVRDSDIGRPKFGGPPVPVHRARFDEWEIDVPVTFDEMLISSGEIVNLFQRAGFSVGIGSYRPECSGENGTFSVVGVKEVGS